MLSIIKAIIANFYWQAALRHLGISSPDSALDAIRKAAKIEPNEKVLPRYLVLQGELEMGLGRKEKAAETFEAAKKIIKKYPEYWYSDAQRDITKRLDNAIEDSDQM